MHASKVYGGNENCTSDSFCIFNYPFHNFLSYFHCNVSHKVQVQTQVILLKQ